MFVKELSCWKNHLNDVLLHENFPARIVDSRSCAGSVIEHDDESLKGLYGIYINVSGHSGEVIYGLG